MKPLHHSFAALILLAAPGAGAVPVAFTGVQYDLLGLAEVSDALGNSVDSQSFSVSAPPGSLPLLPDVTASSADSSAFAFGAADDGYVSVGTESRSAAGENALALSIVSFSGDFDYAGSPLQLWLNLDVSQILAGLASIELTFAVAGLAPESLLFNSAGNDVFTLLRPFSLPNGVTSGTLDFQLVAESAGGSSNLANLAFRIETAAATETVPEPATWLLLPAGLLLLLARRRPGITA